MRADLVTTYVYTDRVDDRTVLTQLDQALREFKTGYPLGDQTVVFKMAKWMSDRLKEEFKERGFAIQSRISTELSGIGTLFGIPIVNDPALEPDGMRIAPMYEGLFK